MAQAFVPLIAVPAQTRPTRGDARVKVIAAEAASIQPFQPAPPPAPAPEAPGCDCRGEPSVEVLRTGDRVHRIRVRCACGEVIELEAEAEGQNP